MSLVYISLNHTQNNTKEAAVSLGGSVISDIYRSLR